MDVTPLIRRDAKVIQAYRDGVFKISGHVYDAPVLLTASSVDVWGETPVDQLICDDFKALQTLPEPVDVVLLGTGKKMVRLSPQLREDIRSQYGFSVDAMDTGAAARTYNVLMAEGRRLAAILYPFKD